MLRFTLRRLLSGVVLLFVVSSLGFILLNTNATGTARTILGPTATQEHVAELTTELGLDQPIIPRYFDWLTGAVRGDFGASWFTKQPVTDAILSRMSVTLSLVVGTIILTALVGTALGVTAARRRGAADRAVQGITVVGFAIPGFLVAILLVNVFALHLGWFKPTGYVSFEDSFLGWLQSVTLPIVALSIAAIAAIASQVRGAVIDTTRQDWVRTLHSRGLPENRILFRHVLRNAGGPALAVLAVQFVGLLGGAVIVEQIFAIPGLGQVSVQGTSQGDIPLVMGLIVAIAAIVVIVNIVIEILHGFLNPKARVS